MKRIYILDTNVILNDANSILKFAEHIVIVPQPVLNEIDSKKREQGELGYNARQFSRIVDELRTKGSLVKGVPLNEEGGMFYVTLFDTTVANYLPYQDMSVMDNRILASALKVKDFTKSYADSVSDVVIVSKDTNMRILADIFGVVAEDYKNSKVASDELFTGIQNVDVEQDLIDKIYEEKKLTLLEVGIEAPYPNECFIFHALSNSKQSALARYNSVFKEFRLLPQDMRTVDIVPKNAEQSFALDLLKDPDVHLVSLTAKAGCGKAQPLDALVLTPSGYVTMGSLSIGDDIISASGEIVKVNGIFPQGVKEIFEIEFSDKTTTECCDEHLWAVKGEKERFKSLPSAILPLSKIRENVKRKDGSVSGKRIWSIPMVDNIEFSEKDYFIDPYLMGVILGDGGLSTTRVFISSKDIELIDKISTLLDPKYFLIKQSSSKYDYSICLKEKYIPNGIQLKGVLGNLYIEEIKNLNLLYTKSNTKFIPDCYKYTSLSNRIKIFQGLMDTDGTVCKRGMSLSYTTVSLQLSEDVKFLVESFGGKCVKGSRTPSYTYKGEKKQGQLAYTLHISLPENVTPFTLERKLNLYVPRSKYLPIRYIENITSVGFKEAQCISIDHPSHLYVTNNFIVTHNTFVALAAGLHGVLGESQQYSKILLLKPIVPMDNSHELGFLPGSLEEKLGPWMASYGDNIMQIMSVYMKDDEEPKRKKGGSKKDNSIDFNEKAQGKTNPLQELIAHGLLEFGSLEHARGRNWSDTYVIIDEAQNTSKNSMKTIMTRIGKGSKIVVMGDTSQIDSPYLDSKSNGLTVVQSLFKDQAISGHITLTKSERSELAEIASELLN